MDESTMEALTDKAVSWVRAQPRDRPFFLYFAPSATRARSRRQFGHCIGAYETMF